MSVVVPVYGVEAYLSRCVDSLLRQTYPNIEIILVDDGSPDRCGALCDSYALIDPRVRVFHQDNAGPSAARNRGIGESHGGYLTFVDPDDWVHEDLIHHLTTIASQTGADVSVCQFVRTTDENMTVPERRGEMRILGTNEALALYGSGQASLMTSPCAKLFRASLFDEVRFPEGRLYEDEFTTWRLMARANRIALSDEVRYFYFIRPESATQRTQGIHQLLDRVDALLEQADFFGARGMADVRGHTLRRAFFILRQQRRRVVASGDQELQEKVKRDLNAVAAALRASGEPIPIKALASFYAVSPQSVDVGVRAYKTIRGYRSPRWRAARWNSPSASANSVSDNLDGVPANLSGASTRTPTRIGRRFSVVIPTMQRSSHLAPLVKMYCDHELVGEVIIVNNVPDPLSFDHPKVRVLQKEQNIFVNPAWNLGAAEAREDLLVISNDDIWFRPHLLNAVELVLRGPVVIVGPSWQAINGTTDRRPFFIPVYRLPHGFGTLMFLRRIDYVPIPDDLLVLGGDDWLFEHQTHRNVQFFGARVGTEWSLTSARPEFDDIKHRDSELFRARYHTDAYHNRFQREARLLDNANRLYRSASSLPSRLRSGGNRGQERHVEGGASVVGVRRGLQVIVVAYGSPDKLRHALEPLSELPVTVVDNSSMPEIETLCAELGCRYLNAGFNRGFAAGVNLGLSNRQIPGGDVLLLNPDAVISVESIRKLQSALLADDRLASVGPRQVDESGEPIRVTWPFPTPLGVWVDALGLPQLRPFSEYVSGAILLLRAEAIEEIGEFDQRFFLYAEEADWQYRASKRGWRSRVVDTVTAMHEGGGTSSNEAKRLAHFHGSSERFLRKHYGSSGWQCARVAQVLGDLVRGLVRRGEARTRLWARATIYIRGPVRAERPFRRFLSETPTEYTEERHGSIHG